MVETVDLGEGRKKISITVGEYSFSVLTQGAILNRFTLDGKNAILPGRFLPGRLLDT